jgi:hypothetical protein
MSKSRRQEAIRLYNRSAELINSMRHERGSKSAGDSAHYYHILWQDVKQFVNDPDFDRCVPSLTTGSQLLQLLLPRRVTVKQVRNKANMLCSYLRDYLVFNYPDTAPQFWPEAQDQEDLEQEIDRLRTRSRSLENALAQAKLRISQLDETLLALKTPSQFEVPEDVLDKLDPLEQARLLEVVQAYRVNAWTPAAAVCGMILESRLQALCRRHGIRSGGIGQMIQGLGEKGLLKGYYQSLAQVGEFFRHRASHPTSEEFDREKTTLVLTALVILIRDLF